MSVVDNHATKSQYITASHAEPTLSVEEGCVVRNHHALAVQKLVGEGFLIAHSGNAVFGRLVEDLADKLIVRATAESQAREDPRSRTRSL